MISFQLDLKSYYNFFQLLSQFKIFKIVLPKQYVLPHLILRQKLVKQTVKC